MFYTRSLQHDLQGFRSASDQRFAGMEQRLTLIHESRMRDSARFASEMRVADGQIHALLTGLTGFDRSSRGLIVELRRILPNLPDTSISQVQQSIDSIAIQLDSVRSTMLAVRLMDDLRHPRFELASGGGATVSHADAPLLAPISLMIWGIAGLIVFLSANFLFDRHRQRELTREIERLRARLDETGRTTP